MLHGPEGGNGLCRLEGKDFGADLAFRYPEEVLVIDVPKQTEGHKGLLHLFVDVRE